MRICICINGRPHEGGMTSFINALTLGLEQSEIEFQVISIFGSSQRRELKPNLTKKADIVLKNKPWLTLLAYLASKFVLGFQLYKSFLFNKYDAIFAMDFSVVNIAYPLNKVFGVPIFHFFLGEVEELIDQEKLKPGTRIAKYFKNEEKKSLTKAKLNLHVPERMSAEYIKNINPKASPIVSFHIPLNTNLFCPDQKARAAYRQKYGIKDSDFLLVFIGRMTPRKGPIYPAMALAKLAKDSPDFKLLYVGDGPEKENIQDFINKAGLADKTIFVGTIDYALLNNFYRMADCFVFSSIDEKENIIEPVSLVVWEAMLCETPVIAFEQKQQADDIKILLENEKNCLLASAKNSDELADAIVKIKNNSPLKEGIIKNAKEAIINGGWASGKAAEEILKITNRYM